MSIKISYANLHSIGGKAINDINVGHDSGIVGSNNGSMQNLPPGVLIMTTDSSMRLIHISKIIGPATHSESLVWVERGGKMWRHNYKVKPLTPVVKLTAYLKIVVKELTGGNDSDFWDNKRHHTHSFYSRIIQQLVEEINGE
jgi:hypothetical protein